jgi:hypothetical protein
MRFGVADALFQNLLGLFDKLPMQVDGVGWDAPAGVVLAEDKLGRLLVIFLHLATMRLTLLGELLRGRAITARVCFFRLRLVSRHALSQMGKKREPVPWRNIVPASKPPGAPGRAGDRTPARRRRSGRG